MNDTVQQMVGRSSLPEDDTARIDFPMFDGLLAYFPNALAEVARVSKLGNDQHNPGEPMHWAREKSTDHENKIVRHLIDAGKFDSRGVRHSARVAWRALALLQVELERDEGHPMARGATFTPSDPQAERNKWASAEAAMRAEPGEAWPAADDLVGAFTFDSPIFMWGPGLFEEIAPEQFLGTIYMTYRPTNATESKRDRPAELREMAVDRLAKQLNWIQGRIDPDGFSAWEEYDERDRAFFRSSIRSLLLDRKLWEIAWGTDDDLVNRCADICEQLDADNQHLRNEP